MTFRLPRVLDQHYTCPTGHAYPEHLTDLDDRTWSCRTCRQSVRITVLDRAGEQFTVERRPARELTENDQVVHWTGVGLTAGAVLHSELPRGKTAGWYLAVECCRGEPIDPGQYIARRIA